MQQPDLKRLSLKTNLQPFASDRDAAGLQRQVLRVHAVQHLLLQRLLGQPPPHRRINLVVALKKNANSLAHS